MAELIGQRLDDEPDADAVPPLVSGRQDELVARRPWDTGDMPIAIMALPPRRRTWAPRRAIPEGTEVGAQHLVTRTLVLGHLTAEWRRRGREDRYARGEAAAGRKLRSPRLGRSDGPACDLSELWHLAHRLPHHRRPLRIQGRGLRTIDVEASRHRAAHRITRLERVRAVVPLLRVHH